MTPQRTALTRCLSFESSWGRHSSKPTGCGSCSSRVPSGRLDLVGLTHTLFYLVPGIQLSAHLVLATVLVQVQHAAVGMQLEAFQNRL